MATPRRPDPRNQRVRCSAKSVLRDVEGQPVLDADGRKQYKPCRNWARKGQEVCRSHGGNTAQALVKAEEQLRRARDPLMAEMLEIAFDRRLPTGDRYKALAWALERAGFKPGMAVELETPGWMQGLKDLVAGKYSDPPDLFKEPVKAASEASEADLQEARDLLREPDPPQPDWRKVLDAVDRDQAGAYEGPLTGEVFDRSGTRIPDRPNPRSDEQLPVNYR